jgi:hypothetical protein
MIAQMGEKYGGMMQKQSNTITGILSNMKDQSGNLMRELGEQIVKAFDLKTKMQGALKYMEEFTNSVRNNGIRQAFSDMLPPGVEFAITGVATALTVAMIPALAAVILKLELMAISAWAAVAWATPWRTTHFARAPAPARGALRTVRLAALCGCFSANANAKTPPQSCPHRCTIDKSNASINAATSSIKCPSR